MFKVCARRCGGCRGYKRMKRVLLRGARLLVLRLRLHGMLEVQASPLQVGGRRVGVQCAKGRGPSSRSVLSR